MEATSALNQYTIKSENDQLIGSLHLPSAASLGANPSYFAHSLAPHPHVQSQLYTQWGNSQPPTVSKYPYGSYGQPQTANNNYGQIASYADTAMYHPQPSPTTESSPAGNPVSVQVALPAPLSPLAYSQAQQSQLAQQSPQPATGYQPASTPSLFTSSTPTPTAISRPPSVVHSPIHEAFAPRGRSTSYSGPYFMPPGLGVHPNGVGFSSFMMASGHGGQSPLSKHSSDYYGISVNGNGTSVNPDGNGNNGLVAINEMNISLTPNGSGGLMASPTSLDTSSSSASTSFDYMQEEHPSPTSSMGIASTVGGGSQYRPVTPGTGQSQVQLPQGHVHGQTKGPNVYSFITPPTSQPLPVSTPVQLSQFSLQPQHQQLPQPQQGLSLSQRQHPPPSLHHQPNSLAQNPLQTHQTHPTTIPRSMSMGNIPFSSHSHSSGTQTPGTAWFNGRATPSGTLTPGSSLSRSTATRLGIPPTVPSLTIPGNFPQDPRTSSMEQQEVLGYPTSGGVSPSTPIGFSSLLKSSIPGGSGPGTASNGGSVPLTPTTDETAPFEYHHSYGFSHILGGGDEDEELHGDEGEDDKVTMPSRVRLPGLHGSPRRGGGGVGSGGVGVARTAKRRRSTALSAGPSAVASVSRSRSGTMGANNGPTTTTTGLGGGSLTMSPVEMHGSASIVPMSRGLSILGTSPTSGGAGSTMTTTTTAGPNTGMNGAAVAAAAIAAVALGGQANSPLAMKELSPAHKPVIETYLNRYLNYLCSNPNAKDRMGHQIHQMYTARRIQRYEQLYGWRPLKFRIEAFVNGFVDLLTACGMSQDVTMKIPHYLNNSRLFSRFNESGNRMKSQGQTIWRVRARCRNDIPPNADAASLSGAYHPHPQQQQQQQQMLQNEIGVNGLMMAPDPLLWEFLPYERSIVGQPPLAIVGTAWQWNMKIHDHWTPRKKVSWTLVSTATSPDATGSGGSAHDGCDSSSSSSVSPSSSASLNANTNTLPRWLCLQGSKLKGTPTEPGVYPISIEATFQEDNDPEPVVVRGNYTIQVSKAIGWKSKVALSQDGGLDSPKGDHVGGGSGDVVGYRHESAATAGRGLEGRHAGSSDGMSDTHPSLIGERMEQLTGMYGIHQGSMRGFRNWSYPFGYVR